jgi:hypothetical protein
VLKPLRESNNIGFFCTLIFKDQKSKRNPLSKAFIRENQPDEPLDLLSSSISQHVTGVYFFFYFALHG